MKSTQTLSHSQYKALFVYVLKPKILSFTVPTGVRIHKRRKKKKNCIGRESYTKTYTHSHILEKTSSVCLSLCLCSTNKNNISMNLSFWWAYKWHSCIVFYKRARHRSLALMVSIAAHKMMVFVWTETKRKCNGMMTVMHTIQRIISSCLIFLRIQ